MAQSGASFWKGLGKQEDVTHLALLVLRHLRRLLTKSKNSSREGNSVTLRGCLDRLELLPEILILFDS